MKVFETIISILDDKGPLPITAICKEVNRMLFTYRDKPFLPSQIKSIVARKKDLFRIQEGNISINPDKHPFLLVATLDGDDGISYQVKVNFIKKRFTFFEWRTIGNSPLNNEIITKKPGDLDEFKRELFTMKLWEWVPSYGKEEGITLGKKNWSIKLKTQSKTYICEGTDCFPKNWGKFCRAIERLTGSNFR
jgi:hypothetical protein